MEPKFHQPVLLEESLSYLITDPKGTYLDCTFGEGGHTLGILDRIDPKAGMVIGIDKDIQILQYGETRVKHHSEKVHLFKANYTDMDLVIKGLGIDSINGIIFDLGVSSYQLDVDERGFSFRHDGPLDMRMDTQTTCNASQLLNHLSQSEIERILKELGEEPFARSISRKIVERRPLNTTYDLVHCVQAAIPGHIRYKMKKHCATRTFQAIRIYLNRELEELADGLEKSLNILGKGGRIVVISFHSLEDRIVKRFFLDHKETILHILTPKPVQASREEQKKNPRSRSAKLRAAQLL